MFLLKYMEHNYQSISLKEMSDFFHYSERHLIQDYTGMSFSKNIRQIRLNRASALLEGDFSMGWMCYSSCPVGP